MFQQHINDFTDHAGAVDMDLNMYEIGGTAAAAMIAVNGVAVSAAIAPVYTGVLGITAGSLWYVGDCKRTGRKLNFFARDTKVKAKVDETPTPVTEPTPGEVVDHSGAEVAPAAL